MGARPTTAAGGADEVWAEVSGFAEFSKKISCRVLRAARAPSKIGYQVEAMGSRVFAGADTGLLVRAHFVLVTQCNRLLEGIMGLGKCTSVEDLQIVGRFEHLREILLSDRYSEHLDMPLAYWVVPTDRRLPMLFLDRTLRDLLNTPFEQLRASRGIGQKKLRAFLTLLARAARSSPAGLSEQHGVLACNGEKSPAVRSGPNGLDPATVSEVVWTEWRATVVKWNLETEALGRFASSLDGMPRVIRNAPLSRYANSTLEEIRGMKTHGEKRVQVILEVFHNVHLLLAGKLPHDHLVVRLVPRLIDRAEGWLSCRLRFSGMPDEPEILDDFVEPLLEQIRTDTSRQISRLAEARVGLHGPIISVRKLARKMGLTRARVYQLLDEINDVMSVRWPTGRHQVYELRDKFAAECDCLEDPPNLEQFLAAIELFYPGSRRGAAGPLEKAVGSSGRDGKPARVAVA